MIGKFLRNLINRVVGPDGKLPPLPLLSNSVRDRIPSDAPRDELGLPDVFVRTVTKTVKFADGTEGPVDRHQVIIPHFIPTHLKGKALKRFLKKHPKGMRMRWRTTEGPLHRQTVKNLARPVPPDARPARRASVDALKRAEER